MSQQKNNLKLRYHLMSKGVAYWQLAKACGIHPEALSRKLRDELDEETTNRFMSIVDEIAANCR